MAEWNGQKLVGETSWTQRNRLCFCAQRGTIGASRYTVNIFWYPNRMISPQKSRLPCAPLPTPFSQGAGVRYLLCKCLLVTVTATTNLSTHARKSLGTQDARDWCVHILKLRFMPGSLRCPHLSHILLLRLYQEKRCCFHLSILLHCASQVVEK